MVSAGGRVENEHVQVCLPESLRRWKEKNHIDDLPEAKYTDQEHNCNWNVQDLKGKTKSGVLKSMNQRIHIWEVFDRQLKADAQLAKYPKVSGKDNVQF